MGVASEWTEIDAGVWLDSDRTRRTVLEQTLAQANGFRITLLALDDVDSEDDSEEDDLEDSWTPRFRR